MSGWLNRRRDWPIRWQLTTFYVALLAAVLGTFGLLLYWQLDRFLLADAQDRLARQVDAAITRATNDLLAAYLKKVGAAGAELPTDPATLKMLAAIGNSLGQELGGRDTRVALYGSDGSLLYSSDTALKAPPWPVPPAKVLNRRPMKPFSMVYEGGDARMLMLFRLIGDSSSPLGVVVVSTSLAGMDAMLQALRLYLTLGIILALLIGVGVGVPLTRRILRPLDRVARTAGEIAAGDLSRRVGLSGERNEIGQVAAAFDRMIEQLEALLKAQRQFVADASHELRTPLTALSGMAEMLLLGIDEDDVAARQRLLRRLAGEIERLNRLVASLLVLSRLDSRPPLVRQEVELAALAGEVVEGLRLSYPDRTAAVLAANPVVVSGDPDRLRQVVLNLIDNAFKYSGAGGNVAVRVAAQDGWAALAVADDGTGIAPEALPHVFDRFFRADPSRARTVGGVGLGLAIARAIVEAHGGRIEAASAGLGRGSLFTVRLRLAPPPPIPVPSDAPPPAISPVSAAPLDPPRPSPQA